MIEVNEKYYGVLIDYVFGSSDPRISCIASGYNSEGDKE